MGLEEGVESGTDGEEGNAYHHAHHAVEHDGAPCLTFVACGEIALYHRLVRGVADEVVGHSSDDDYPECSTFVRKAPVEEPHLSVAESHVQTSADTSFGACSKPYDGKECSSDKDEALYDVAPYHGLHASHGTIYDGDGSHEYDADVDVDAGHRCECQRGEVEHECHACHHEDDEECACHQSCGGVEALLQVFVGGRDVQASEEGEVIAYDGEGDDEDGHQHGVVCPVRGIGFGGIGHIGDGTEHGGIDGYSCRPPWYASASLEEVVGTAFALHEVVSQSSHSCQVKCDDEPSCPSEMPCGGNLDAVYGIAAYSRHGFATHYGPTSVRGYHCSSCTGKGFVVTGMAPRSSYGIVDEYVAVEAVPFGGMAQVLATIFSAYGLCKHFAVGSAEDEYMLRPRWHGGGSHDGCRLVGTGSVFCVPLAICGAIA